MTANERRTAPAPPRRSSLRVLVPAAPHLRRSHTLANRRRLLVITPPDGIRTCAMTALPIGWLVAGTRAIIPVRNAPTRAASPAKCAGLRRLDAAHNYAPSPLPQPRECSVEETSTDAGWPKRSQQPPDHLWPNGQLDNRPCPPLRHVRSLSRQRDSRVTQALWRTSMSILSRGGLPESVERTTVCRWQATVGQGRRAATSLEP